MERADAQYVDALRARTSSYLTQIEAAVRAELQRYTWSRFYGPLLYAVEGGKRIRPLILLLSAEATGRPTIADPLPAAVATELLHTESIIHDDIIDQQISRRDRASFHIKYGYGASVLTADFVLGIILDIAARYRDPRIAHELSGAALHLSEGELWELKIDPRTYRLPWDEYVRILAQKTAALFQAAAKLGAVIGGGSDPQITALATYGLKLGIAYQIHDDILDWGEEGKVTQALHLPKTPAPLEHMKRMAKDYANQASAQLRALPSTPSRDFLAELAQFTIRRRY